MSRPLHVLDQVFEVSVRTWSSVETHCYWWWWINFMSICILRTEGVCIFNVHCYSFCGRVFVKRLFCAPRLVQGTANIYCYWCSGILNWIICWFTAGWSTGSTCISFSRLHFFCSRFTCWLRQGQNETRWMRGGDGLFLELECLTKGLTFTVLFTCKCWCCLSHCVLLG